jgi:hypothetical protein
MTFPATVNSQITDAIAARQAQITQLGREIEALQTAASALRGQKTARGAASTPKTKTGRRPMSAAARKAVSARMKASWAKRKKASKPTPKTSRQTQTKTKTRRKPWTAAERLAISKRMKASWAKRKRAKRAG